MSNNPAATDTTQAGATNGTATGATADAKTYTQAQLDAMFGERAKSAAATARADTLKELGFEKLDDAKTAIGQYKTLSEAQKTEQQKALDRAAAAEKERDDWKAKHEAEVKRVNDALMKSAVMAEATKAGFADPDDAWAFADKSKLSIEGETVKGAKDVVEGVLKAKPHLKAGAVKAPNINATNTTQVDPLAGREEEIAARFKLSIPKRN